MIRLVRKWIRRYIGRQKANELASAATIEDGVIVQPSFFWKLPARRTALRVGQRTILDGRIVVRGQGQVTIGGYCSFRTGTYIGALRSITIGSNVFAAEGVFISDNNNHPTSPRARREMTEKPPGDAVWGWEREDVDAAAINIEDNVWLGRNSMILKGVTIGRGSIVAAGSVVTKCVPQFSIVAGNPACVVKQLTNDLDD